LVSVYSTIKMMHGPINIRSKLASLTHRVQNVLSAEDTKRLHTGSSVHNSPLCRPLHTKVRRIPDCCQPLCPAHSQHNFLLAVCSNTPIDSCHLGFVSRRKGQSEPNLGHRHNTKFPLMKPWLVQLTDHICTYIYVYM